MIEEEALVTHVEADQVWVEKPRQSACAACKTPCATAGVADYLEQGKPDLARLVVSSPIEVRAGDRVVLGIEEGAIVKGSFAIYLLPLLGLLAGAILGQTLGGAFATPADLAAASGGLAGLAATLAFLKFSRLSSRNTPRPVVLRKLG
ncbi:SoxR reducing system RseC family protein [Methylomagnum ishizawai]|uniref:SoxR reducing system RseC family protein n=1 Tax=Methylomagnum ishizawai TaxID=1760988 RepID=UPI001C3347D7|nr:SoxR reducing system RseC family protein [Methylomagnum ishizawai]BBL76054.1 hypothetical protein MishRS11D_31520 [Methylomagnum ishizawai]